MPVRTCVVCREEKEKKSLYRFVLLGEAPQSKDLRGRVLGIDLLQVEAGRGAYICKSGTCLRNSSALNRLRGILGLGSKATKGERKKVFQKDARAALKLEKAGESGKSQLHLLGLECLKRQAGLKLKSSNQKAPKLKAEKALNELLEIIAGSGSKN